MGSGIQLWDAAGNLVFDTSDRITRIIGTFVIGATATGSITNADFATGTIWWSIVPSSSVIGMYVPDITIDSANNKISYSPKPGATPGPSDVTIMYGVY